MIIKEISQPNAALKIEVIELSEEEKKSLTTNVDYIEGESIAMATNELDKSENDYINPYSVLGKMVLYVPVLAEALKEVKLPIKERIEKELHCIHLELFDNSNQRVLLRIDSKSPSSIYLYAEGYKCPINYTTIEVDLSTPEIGVKTQSELDKIGRFLNFFKEQYNNPNG